MFRKLMLSWRLGVIFILREYFFNLPEAPHRQRLSLWITHSKYVSKLVVIVVMISYMLHAYYAWQPWMNGLNQSRHINSKEETMGINPVINSHSSRVTIKKFANRKMRPAKEKNIPVWPFLPTARTIINIPVLNSSTFAEYSPNSEPTKIVNKFPNFAPDFPEWIFFPLSLDFFNGGLENPPLPTP